MNKYRKISRTCLYFGILMVLIAMDWIWYAKTYPDSSFVLELSYLPVIYGVFAAVTAGCFAAAALFGRKAGREQAAQGTGARRKTA